MNTQYGTAQQTLGWVIGIMNVPTTDTTYGTQQQTEVKVTGVINVLKKTTHGNIQRITEAEVITAAITKLFFERLGGCCCC